MNGLWKCHQQTRKVSSLLGLEPGSHILLDVVDLTGELRLERFLFRLNDFDGLHLHPAHVCISSRMYPSSITASSRSRRLSSKALPMFFLAASWCLQISFHADAKSVQIVCAGAFAVLSGIRGYTFARRTHLSFEDPVKMKLN